jgi:transposase
LRWAKAKESRDQIVLFPTKLDDSIGSDHSVRTLWGILSRLDWSSWESKYSAGPGQPPIHPSIISGVILYGLLKRIRTTRGLEEALEVRMDFRWLAEGRSIDHTTISRFRQSNVEALGDLFVQVGLVAQKLGHLTLVTLGYDGTRLRASNRRSGTRSPKELREAKKQLEIEFAAHTAAAKAAQSAEDQAFDTAAHQDKGKDLERRNAQIEAALAEIQEIENSGKQVPDRLPITDPQSRVCPNKEGGFGPNHNPTATVDADSGLIVDADVIRGTDEQNHMHAAVDRVRENFLQEDPAGADRPVEVLADGLMATGANIAACEAKNVEFYSPAGPQNPAYRDDPNQPVAEDDLARLPLRGKRPKKGQEDTRKFDKSAFLYWPEQDVYYCPMGKQLQRRSKTKDKYGNLRHIYRADKTHCAACPLKDKCFKNTRNQYGRRIECGEHEVAKQAHAAKMQSETSRSKYARRAAVTERPFAIIKRAFGARAFLTRGLKNVRQEWRWLSIAYNLHRLLRLMPTSPAP